MKTKKANSSSEGREVRVLILTSDLDFATDRVCRALSDDGVSFLRLNRESLAGNALTLDPVNQTLICRRDGDVWIAGEELRSVWWRQGTFDRTPFSVGASLDEQMARTQWSAFCRALMAIERPMWVNHPSRVYRAETKAVQLGEAARIGFDVPYTLMTNDRDADIEGMIGRRVALKSLDTLLLRQGADQLFGYTTLVEWGEVATAQFHLAPATVQSAVESKLDLRVTVLGKDVWSVAIACGGRGIAGDWRLTAKQDIEIVDHVLPKAVVERCIDFVCVLGLKYGAIDLALSQGRYWFIEINPTGEWGWLDCASRPIASQIARFLADPC